MYWCTTPDSDEDCFVVAESAAVARRFHEDAEGYGRGEAHAELPGTEAEGAENVISRVDAMHVDADALQRRLRSPVEISDYQVAKS